MALPENNRKAVRILLGVVGRHPYECPLRACENSSLVDLPLLAIAIAFDFTLFFDVLD
ncbi:hypothetical protein [Natronococcus wangiae]|uniref:hypothetical protein n=1 Tax=Natronococcus wangiae TaxID=3068275 RepID=UPI00273FA443|nr:hypothetical protein [Natronococcus sp. AD5]